MDDFSNADLEPMKNKIRNWHKNLSQFCTEEAWNSFKNVSFNLKEKYVSKKTAKKREILNGFTKKLLTFIKENKDDNIHKKQSLL